MSTEFLEYWVGEHFVPCIVDGDITGLSDAEEELILHFMSSITQELREFFLAEISEERNEFGYCEVTCLHGPVVKVRFYRQEW